MLFKQKLLSSDMLPGREPRGMGVHHVPGGRLCAALEVCRLLLHHDLLPRVDGQERFHRRHYRDVQRDPRAVPTGIAQT